MSNKINFKDTFTLSLDERVNVDKMLYQLNDYFYFENIKFKSRISGFNKFFYVSDYLENDYSLVSKKGRLSTRISRIVRSVFDINLSPEQKSRIGNIIRANTIPESLITIKFSKALDWKPGDFGDEGSCFFGGRRYTGNALRANDNYMAILFLSDVDAKTGKSRGYKRGRMLIKKTRFYYVLFNSYGPYTPEISARLFSQFLYNNDKIKKIKLTNWGGSNGRLWINLDSGYAVPQEDYTWRELPNKVDLRTKIPY